MEENMMQQPDQEGLEYLSTSGRPIPGSSLANSPESPFPWEQPPQYTELQPAQDAIFLEITEPEAYHSLMELIRNDLLFYDLHYTYICILYYLETQLKYLLLLHLKAVS